MKKIIAGSFVCVSLIWGITGCSNPETNEADGEDGVTEVEFWHTMSGDNGDYLEELVEDFNEQSDSVRVKPIFQGDYEDIQKKLRTGGGSQSIAPIVMTGDNDVPHMVNNEYITPMQEFIDEDDEVDTSEYEENILQRYEMDDKLYAMPMSSSNLLVYYNKDTFEEAGLDPEDPPKTFSDIKEMGKKITEETDQIGFTTGITPWALAQLVSNQGGMFFNNDNGHSGEPTEALFNSEEGVRAFEWLDEMHEDGILENMGRDWGDISTAFVGEDAGIIAMSTADIKGNVDNADFEVGVSTVPVPEGTEPQGLAVGGNALWITKDATDEHKEAGWELVKFLSSKEGQAKWSANTGYLPLNKKSIEEEELKEAFEEYPQMEVAVKQLKDSKIGPVTQGTLADNWWSIEDIIASEWEEMYDGKDPKEAIDDAADKTNEELN